MAMPFKVTLLKEMKKKAEFLGSILPGGMTRAGS